MQGWLARPSPGGRSASSGPMKDDIAKARLVPWKAIRIRFNGLALNAANQAEAVRRMGRLS
jgi:hypothetical protein